MTTSGNTRKLFQKRESSVRRSAGAIVPLVLRYVHPGSVIDIGCGTGTFLRVLASSGVREYQGMDGDCVDPASLQIPPERFLSVDLESPLPCAREYDLVVCLETAQHLCPSRARSFIEDLTDLGPVILFSSAIPHQGGTYPLNEQWPDYWIGLFKSFGYTAVDCLRRHLWENPAVSFRYAQNILLYADSRRLSEYPPLADAARDAPGLPVRLVHPEKYLRLQARVNALKEEVEYWKDPANIPAWQMLRALPSALKTAGAQRVKKIIRRYRIQPRGGVR